MSVCMVRWKRVRNAAVAAPSKQKRLVSSRFWKDDGARLNRAMSDKVCS